MLQAISMTGGETCM